MDTTYTAIIQYDSQPEEYIPLIASNDRAARKQTAVFAAKYKGAHVFCGFSRDSDGQRGYINRNGADITGEPY